MSDTETEHQNQSEQSLDEPPKYYAELVDHIISRLEHFFSSHLDDMFQLADDFLFKAADEATSTAEQNSLFECMNAIRGDKKTIQQGFVDELSYYLQPMSELDQLPEKKQSKKPEVLGLVEQNEMDEMVILNTISSKAAMDHAESINHLIARFQELGKYNDDIFHGDALEPKRLCDAMHEALSKTELIDSNRLVVFRFFNEGLVKDIGGLYDDLNNLLIEQGLLPVIDFSGAVPHYEAPASDGGALGEELAGQNMSEQALSGDVPQPQGRRAFGSGMMGYSGSMPAAAPVSGGASMPPSAPGFTQPMADAQSGGHSAAGVRRAFGSGMQGFSQGSFQGNPQEYSQGDGAQSSVSPNQTQGPAGQAYSAGVPVSQVRQSIENYVGGPHANTHGGAGYYSQQQVMTALTGLQSPTTNLSQTPLVFDAEQIKKAVLSSIGETEGGAVTKAVHQVSEKTIDFIKLIFDAIIDEESITDEIKTLLLSLQIPVIKAAMQDADFFVDDQHPARQLLDKIAEAGVGVSEHKDPVYIDIEKIVRKLLNDYDDDVVAFTIALEELKALTEEIYRAARETEAKSQKAVKMAHAKSIVLQEIRKITVGKELPQGVRTLVLKIWPSMMFNHFLANGKANDEWVELLIILQKIIESVQPLYSEQEIAELGLSYQDIVDAVKLKLKKCKKGQDIIAQVIAELDETYQGLMDTSDLPKEPLVDAELAEHAGSADTPSDEVMELDSSSAAEIPEPEAKEDPEVISKRKLASLPEGVAPGAWFIVYNGEDKPVRRLKLAVILLHDASMVFVDHLGNVVIEKDAEIFSDEIERGLSGIIMQHSVFDHALNSALKTIEH